MVEAEQLLMENGIPWIHQKHEVQDYTVDKKAAAALHYLEVLFPHLKALVLLKDLVPQSNGNLIQKTQRTCGCHMSFVYPFSHFYLKKTFRPIPKQLEKLGFGKEAPQNFYSERATIAERQGASENENSEAKPTQPKTNFSSCLGIMFSYN
jgi:hypothetical protein